MPRKIGYWLALGAAGGCVMGAIWPGPPSNPAALISRVDAIVIGLLAVIVHWPVRRKYGPAGLSWIARIVRIAGFALVATLLLVKNAVERHEFARLAGRPALTGVWAGEIAFLFVIAAYLAGLLAITARRPPTTRATTVIGVSAGLLLGGAVYVLRPLDNPVHISDASLNAIVEIMRVAAVPAVIAAATAAVVMAARRTSRRDRDGAPPSTHGPARQGVAAGLCVGITCALMVSVLGIATIAVTPAAARSIQWTIPGSGGPSSLYQFEINASHAVAGYLLILIIFPFLGAGIGAWGGLFAAGNRGLRPGGGGGGGTRPPQPKTPPPGGGRQLDPRPVRIDARGLLNLPQWDPRTQAPQSAPAREPAGR